VELFQDAEFWVGVAFVILAAILIWAKVPRLAAAALDAKAEKIQAELDEAARLRKEAEGLLEQIRARREETERLAKDMLANAEVEARQIESEAHARIEEQIKRRGELAQQKIAQAEAEAAADVKSAAAELATEVAAAVLTHRAQSLSSDPAVDKAVSELPAKLQ
jgi:F-type H+-transporting ATPase subunit b